ncbi:MAG: hypothetical protein FGM15_10130 [Chthoniobacterales bacterium]|nr:hypothetical protein [Chthoniobacterales bacterium]
MPKERVLITVKTYPTLSRKYGETVCTAGLREDGSWVRIYPVPFRRLGEKEQYRKYDWIECDLVRNEKDPRPESYHPTDLRQIKKVDHLGTEDKWRGRRNVLLGRGKVFKRLDSLIKDAKANKRSLAIFKPARILDFVWEEEDREWDAEKLAEMRNLASQGELFDEEAWRKTFKVIPKLPYSFSYRFEDADGTKSKLQILDWEIGALFDKCRKAARGDEEAALAKVKQMYFDKFTKTDLHFFLGTTQSFHLRAPNPWVIIGVLPLPHQLQQELF